MDVFILLGIWNYYVEEDCICDVDLGRYVQLSDN